MIEPDFTRPPAGDVPTCDRCPAEDGVELREWSDDGDHAEHLCEECWAVAGDETLDVEPVAEASPARVATAGENLAEAYRPTRAVDRNLAEVISELLAVIPIDHHRLLDRLTALQQSVMFTAPEAMTGRWWQVATVLDEEVPAGDELVAAVAGIFGGGP